MTPPHLGGGDEEVHSSPAASSGPADCISQNGVALKERNYLGLSSDCSSVDSSGVSSLSNENKGNNNNNNLNFKATELRLGLPGSHSPEREEPGLSLLGPEKQLFPLLPGKNAAVVLGNKRGFSESESPRSVGQGKINAMMMKDAPGPGKAPLQERSRPTNGGSNNAAPAAKAQVVGWPPIRSFRKNSLTATTSKNNEEVDGKPSLGALFIKVSMDGAPYLRKVDLRTHASYQDLSSALEKMFSCFTIGQCGSHGAPGKEKMSESKLRDLLHGSEYVLTYEDRDGDWMLVGDVPWEMFIDTCKKLKIMKGSDAIGLAPRAVEKSQNRN